MKRYPPHPTLFFVSRRHGSVLPIMLLITSAMALLAAGIWQTAVLSALLSQSVAATDRAFWSAETGTEVGLAYIDRHLQLLPVSADTTVDLPNPLTASDETVRLRVNYIATDSDCENLAGPAVRHHYELHAHAINQLARETHVQGFYLCSETCLEQDCVVAEQPPVRHYWYRLPGA